MKYLLILLISTNILFAKGPVDRFFKGEYKEFEDYKAYAVAINNHTGAWASGYSKNAPTKTIAKNNALKACKKFAKKHKVNRKCRLYAVGNKKVYNNY